MKFILPIFIILTIFLYLNKTYAYFYTQKGIPNLKSPYTQTNLYLKSTSATSSAKLIYIALGDSLTAGVGSISYKTTYPYVFARNMAQKNDIELINLGIPGATSRQVLDDEIPKVIQVQPNIITLLVGINDLHNQTSSKQYEKNMTQIIDELTRKTKAKIIVLNIPYLGDNTILYPPYNFLLNYQTKQFNNSLKEATKNQPITLIDLYGQTKQDFIKNSNLYSSDHFHPSGDGYQLFGSLIHEN